MQKIPAFCSGFEEAMQTNHEGFVFIFELSKPTLLSGFSLQNNGSGMITIRGGTDSAALQLYLKNPETKILSSKNVNICDWDILVPETQLQTPKSSKTLKREFTNSNLKRKEQSYSMVAVVCKSLYDKPECVGLKEFYCYA
jgi:hypothetical protein